MRVTFFIAVTIFGYAAMATRYYSDIRDNVDVTSILRNERLFKPYMACLLEKGPCPADARALKTILPEMITTNCARCTQKHKDIVITIFRYLKQHKQDAYTQVVQKYDPNNQFIEKFYQFLEQELLR